MARASLPPQKTSSTLKTRLKEMPLRVFIPNMITLLALCLGMTAIRFCLSETPQYQAAVLAITAAAFLDGLDGRIARLLKGTTPMGAQLDSLADMVNFGVAPALILYMWVLHAAGGLGWTAALLFTVCAAVRLARFNVMAEENPPPVLPADKGKFFIGMPSPAAALLVLTPMMLNFALEGFFIPPLVVAGFTAAMGLMMVSRVPMFAFKKIRLSKKALVPLFCAIAVVAGLFFSHPWLVLCVCAGGYLMTIPLSIRAAACGVPFKKAHPHDDTGAI